LIVVSSPVSTRENDSIKKESIRNFIGWVIITESGVSGRI
jgi:hypothetical protein